MKDQFHRILDLVRKTGDTMVVTDPNGENVFVVMDIDQYEVLLDVNQYQESEMDEEEIEKEEESDHEADIWGTMQSAGDESETWDVSKMNEKELQDLEEQYREFAQRNVKDVIKTPAKTEESLNSSNKSHNADDFGEEQFYLEPIE